MERYSGIDAYDSDFVMKISSKPELSYSYDKRTWTLEVTIRGERYRYFNVSPHFADRFDWLQARNVGQAMKMLRSFRYEKIEEPSAKLEILPKKLGKPQQLSLFGGSKVDPKAVVASFLKSAGSEYYPQGVPDDQLDEIIDSIKSGWNVSDADVLPLFERITKAIREHKAWAKKLPKSSAKYASFLKMAKLVKAGSSLEEAHHQWGKADGMTDEQIKADWSAFKKGKSVV